VVRAAHHWSVRLPSSTADLAHHQCTEGWNNNCRNASILNNQIGPSGNSPNTAQQFKRAVAYQGPGYWCVPLARAICRCSYASRRADGISNACAGSTIKGNTIVDATDGAIVQFGAPNTTISGNTYATYNSVSTSII
jgi:hypothetical protein